jgi:hypothetical protein
MTARVTPDERAAIVVRLTAGEPLHAIAAATRRNVRTVWLIYRAERARGTVSFRARGRRPAL